MSEQTKIKPKIEEIASEYLDGKNLNNLLDFVAWMRANKMTPTFANKSKTGVNYTSHICYVKLFHGYWYIWISGKHRIYKHLFIDDFLSCEELKEIIGANLAKCSEGCKHGCNEGQGYTVTVCGKKYEKICGSCTVRFRSPNAKTLKIIKKVIETRNTVT